MRLTKQHIERDGSGDVTLYPEEPEDMWHAYNLILPSDLLRASAVRRVTTESASGSTSSHRVHANFTIRVRRLDFDSHAGQLHVAGQIAEENQYTKLGQHHTLDLELHRNFTIIKTLDGDSTGWDSIAIQQLRDATDQQKGAEAVAVVMQEGLANICYITSYQTIVRQTVNHDVKKKRGAGRSADHDKSLSSFFKKTLETLLRQIDLSEQKPILLASAGYTATQFQTYIMDTAFSSNNKALLAQKPNFLVVHSSSGSLHALNEVLRSQTVLSKLKDTKYFRETQLMDTFMDMLRKDEGRAWYGPKEVESAVEQGAVGRGGGVLLISHQLFRSQDVGVRRRWVALVDKVRDDEGGEVRVLSSDHESGQRLEGLGGIAAILTFPIEDVLDEQEEENEVDSR